MARERSPSDFTVSVEGIGTFTFAKRRMADEINVQVEYARIIQGVEPTDWLALVGGWLSVLRVLTVAAPEGWNIDEMDPLDNDTYLRLGRVHKALADKERSFRPGAASPSADPREGAGAVA